MDTKYKQYSNEEKIAYFQEQYAYYSQRLSKLEIEKSKVVTKCLAIQKRLAQLTYETKKEELVFELEKQGVVTESTPEIDKLTKEIDELEKQI